MKVRSTFVAAALASAAVFALNGHVRASTIASIEGDASGTVGVSLGTSSDPIAVVTAIGSVAGAALDGYSYTNWAIIADDGTASLELFGHFPAGDSYSPTVGDGITATGTYSPFNDIPEVDALTAISATSTGNTVPAPLTVTVPQLAALQLATPNYGILGYLITVDDVTLSGATTFKTHANTTLTATDSSSNTVTVFQYASSYSAAGAFGGLPVPTGPVDLTGIADVFSTGPEFIPFAITPYVAVPEPTSLSLIAMGGLALLNRRRR